MKTIKVQFTWTKIMKLPSNNDSSVNAIHVKVNTEIRELTFDEISSIHFFHNKMEPKKRLEINYNHGYLTNDLHDCSVRLHLDKLRQEVEKEDTLYEVELDYAWLRFTPLIIKTKKETV